jgi:hypothetical protein
LHTGIAIDGHPFALSFDELRQRGREIRVGDAHATVPSGEHLLLHETVHFAWSHVMSFGAWRTMRDIQLMAARQFVDWESFVNEAQRHRADTCAYWTLAMAEILAGAEIPPGVLQRLQPRLSGLVRGFLMRHFLYHLIPIETDWPSHRLRQYLWEVAIQPDRFGHGPRRPWEFDERSPEPTMQHQVQGERTKMLQKLARLGVWARYVRAVS